MIGKILNTLTLVLMLFGFLGCNPNNPSPSNLILKWDVTINGQTYNWQGEYPNSLNGGSATATGLSPLTPFGINCYKASPAMTMGFTLPSYSAGTFNLSPNTMSNNSTMLINFNGNQEYSSAWGGSVTVNVTEFPTNINQVIKGNFNGTIGKSPLLGGGTSSISGSFQVLRVD